MSQKNLHRGYLAHAMIEHNLFVLQCILLFYFNKLELSFSKYFRSNNVEKEIVICQYDNRFHFPVSMNFGLLTLAIIIQQ